MSDFIEDFLTLTEGIPSPELFRLWAGISTVAGALERRVWVQTSQSVLYPNLFVLLVAAPGIGKSQALQFVENLWRAAKRPNGTAAFHVAPNSVTKAALVDSLETAERRIVVPGGVVEYHTLLISADEFGVLCPAHDLEFLNVINYIYNNPKYYEEKRRHNKQNTEIIHPQLNLIAGAQPGFLSSVLPETAWSMGFTSRLIMIYAAHGVKTSLFDGQESRDTLFKKMASQLSSMSTRMGGFIWDDDARLEMQRWHQEGCQPEPDHTRLIHYNQRRIMHALKLTMVSAASRTDELRLTMYDVERARNWLLQAEQLMPDIFAEMKGNSDIAVITELWQFLWKIWMKSQKAIHEARLINFLRSRVPTEKILRIIEVAEKSNMLTRLAGDQKMYVPRHRDDWGVEA